MTFVIDEIKHLLRCAHCLNHGASNRVVIENKLAPNGDDAAKGPNGEAVAYMCDAHKETEPKFAHQILNAGSINVIRVEELKDMPAPTVVVEEKPIVKEFTKEEMGDEEA